MATYEWDVEHVEVSKGFRDIIEHNFQKSFRNCQRFIENYGAPDTGTEFDIVLIRDDEQGRSWAYMDDGKLPEFFTDAWDRDTAKVPKRFHAEAAK